MRTPLLLVAFLALAACQKVEYDTSAFSTNEAPVATAGADVSQPADQMVTLDGHGSYDPDGDPITYHWAFEYVPDGSTVASRESPFPRNHSTDAVTTTFYPDVVGTYVISLKVHDGYLYSAPDYVVITATEPESRPTADAGPDQTVPIGTAVTLNGTNSFDPLGRTLAYTWTLAQAPEASSLTTASISNAAASVATLAPDVKGVYIVNLVVNNGLTDSLPDGAMITVTALNGVPTANAGPDILTAEDCTAITLDCSASVDPDGDPLTYFWSIQSKPATSTATDSSFADRTDPITTFWADTAGTYIFSCSVNDGTAWSSPDTVTVTVLERSYNTAPSVSAGDDKNEVGGEVPCTEDGYSSDCDECPPVTTTLGEGASLADADGDPLTYGWTVVSGDATVSDPSALSTTVTLASAQPTGPGTCVDTAYEFMLAATDCPGATSSDNLVITVTCCGVEAAAAAKAPVKSPDKSPTKAKVFEPPPADVRTAPFTPKPKK